MIPDTYMKVGMIPRDTDGRVQYEVLPLPEQPAEKERVAPQATIGTIAEIVKDVLQVSSVDSDADLFELGMTSLAAAHLLTRIHTTFGIAPDMCQMRAEPTITAISHRLHKSTSLS
jgi:acyl carrier protein